MEMFNHHELPQVQTMPTHIDIDELMDVTARLADILEEETGYLKGMELESLARLQEKKQELTLVMESYQKILRANPDMLKQADADKLAEFSELAEDFTRVVEENFRRTAVARSVNQRVVQTIIDVMSEQNRPATYNRYGNSSTQQDMSLSLNLNQTA